MSIFHKDKCTKEQVSEFKKKVVSFLHEKGIIYHKVTALTSYNGEIRIYTGGLDEQERRREGRKLVAWKNEDGSYGGEAEAIEVLKRRGIGDKLYQRVIGKIIRKEYLQVFLADDWEGEKKAILDFFKDNSAEVSHACNFAG